MKINRAKIKLDYRKELKGYHKDIDTLDSEDRSNGIEYAKMYYNYLTEAGIPYARLALDVIENKGKFGKLANIHLKSQSLFEGIQAEAMPAVREKIIISLASHDAKMRGDKDYNQSNPCYDKIEAYHLKVFKYHTSPYAWGGLAPKELIGSGSWMKLYEEDSGILEGIEEIMKQGKIGKSLEYSAERMLKSLAHSYNQYIINSNTPFQLMMSTTSKEQASVIWKIDPDRISEIEDDTSMLDSVSSRVFKARAAEHFVPSGEFDYSSSDSEEEEYLSKTLSANKVINKQLQALLSSPDDLKNHQKESFNNSLKDLKLAEEFAPNITKSSLESIAEHNGFIQELIGIKNPNQALEKIKKSEQEEEKMTPVVKDLVQNIKNQEVITQKKKSSNTKEQKLDSEDWLTDIISHTQTAMNDAYNDPDMQQFLQTLGGNSNFNFEDND